MSHMRGTERERTSAWSLDDLLTRLTPFAQDVLAEPVRERECFEHERLEHERLEHERITNAMVFLIGLNKNTKLHLVLQAIYSRGGIDSVPLVRIEHKGEFIPTLRVNSEGIIEMTRSFAGVSPNQWKEWKAFELVDIVNGTYVRKNGQKVWNSNDIEPREAQGNEDLIQENRPSSPNSLSKMLEYLDIYGFTTATKESMEDTLVQNLKIASQVLQIPTEIG